MSECFRCNKKLSTGDKYAVEARTDTDHRFYHQSCIKNDPATRNKTKSNDTRWIEYPTLVTNGRKPLYEERK